MSHGFLQVKQVSMTWLKDTYISTTRSSLLLFFSSIFIQFALSCFKSSFQAFIFTVMFLYNSLVTFHKQGNSQSIYFHKFFFPHPGYTLYKMYIDLLHVTQTIIMIGQMLCRLRWDISILIASGRSAKSHQNVAVCCSLA